MSLFQRGNPETTERQALDRERLEHGALPLAAEKRLRDLKSRAHLFTSNLSVNEFVLTTHEGIRPLGQVMGTSIYHVGWQYVPATVSTELISLTHAYSHARMLACSRLQQEARLLGAHGVIGVRLVRSSYDWGKDLLEFSAQGTAVAIPGHPIPEQPFLSALSGQEFWSLRCAGYHPVGLVFGTCIYYQVESNMTHWMRQGNLGQGFAQNVELRDYTDALATVRQMAMSRLEAEAARMQANGVVGMTIDELASPYEVEVSENYRRLDLIVEFTALGTAIAESQNGSVNIHYTVSLDA